LGKTTLAAALCHHEDTVTAFDDGILWATLGEKPNLLVALTKLYAALSGERPGFVDIDDAAINLGDKLEDKNCLVVIDDVWDAAHLRPFLRGGSQCARLVTTRRSDLAMETERVSVDAMAPDEAVELLLTGLSGRPLDVLPFRDLAKRLGGWPLLLGLTAAALRNRLGSGDTLNGALNYLQKKLDKQGVVAFDQRNSTERNQAITKTIEVSLELLTQHERDRYHEVALFHEDTDIPLQPISRLWQMDQFDAEELLQRLDHLALLKFSLQTASVRVHDVLRAYSLGQLKDLPRSHDKLLASWGDPLALTDSYASRWLAYHFVEAGRTAELRVLLLNFEWIRKKLDATDVTALLSDYSRMKDGDLEVVQETIRLAAHVLVHEKTQLAAQLLGRLPAQSSDDIHQLRMQADHWRGTTWLRPLTSALVGPGGNLLFTLTGHTGRVRSVAVTSDGRRAISGSDDCTVKVWNLERGSEERTLTGHGDWIRRVAVVPSKQHAISVSDDRTLRVWDLDSGTEIQRIKVYFDALTALATTPDGTSAVTGSHRYALKVWDLERGAEIATLKGHKEQIHDVAVAPDGKYAVSASADCTLKVWNLSNGAEERTLKGHTAPVHAVAISSDGKRIVSLGADDTLRVWDLHTGEETRHIGRHAYWATGIALTPDGAHAISAFENCALKSWDLDRGIEVNTYKGHTDWINAVALTPDGHHAISGSDDNTVRVWDLKRKSQHRAEATQVHESNIWSLAVTPDGRYFVSVSDDMNKGVWKLEAGEPLCIARQKSRWPIAITCDGMHVLSPARYGAIKLSDLHTGIVKQVYSGHTDRVTALCITPNGTHMVSAADDRMIRIWNLSTGATERTINIAHYWIRALAVTPDGSCLITSSEGHGLKAWDLRRGTEEKTLSGHAARVNAVAVLPDGARVVSASDDKTIKVWNLATGQVERTLLGHTAKINSLAVMADGRNVVSAAHDNTVKVWSVRTGNPIATFTGDSPMCACVVGRLGVIIAGDLSGRLHVLRLEHVEKP
jgi:WD40 repeat protein